MTVQFYVDKANATLADSLIAFGLANIVNELLQAQIGDDDLPHIRILDEGGYYALDCDPTLETATVEQFTGRIEPAPLIITVKNHDQLADVDYLNRVDYEAKKLQRNIFLEFMSKMGKAVTQVPSDQRPPEPDSDWDIYRAINPAALPGYNNLLMAWAKTRPAQAEVLWIILELFSTTPNYIVRATKAWKVLDKKYGWEISAAATTLQLYNPDQGKGQNQAKADALSMRNVRNFWLLEFLKAVGLYHAGITRTLRGVKDRKSYVIAPKEIDYAESGGVLQNFKTLTQVGRPSITSDIMAAVNYVRAMLQYAAERQSFSLKLFNAKKPRNLVTGFYTAFYKDLGNAVAAMNLSFIALPAWIEIRDDHDTQRTREALDEIERLTWTIDETHSDGYRLLNALRDFLSGGDLNQLFDFTSAYTGYYMGRRERNHFAHQLSADLVRSVAVGTEEKLAPIFENEGFKNVAYAIRQSTVTAQYRKKQQDRRYDVRYGLGQELARKSRYPDEFVTALADFVHKYNAENAQVAERFQAMGREGASFRRNVKTSDIEAVVKLVDTYGAPLIANLLIAYGYARVEQPQQDAEPASDQLPSDLPDTTEDQEYDE
jgi:hypothetical protein